MSENHLTSVFSLSSVFSISFSAAWSMSSKKLSSARSTRMLTSMVIWMGLTSTGATSTLCWVAQPAKSVSRPQAKFRDVSRTYVLSRVWFPFQSLCSVTTCSVTIYSSMPLIPIPYFKTSSRGSVKLTSSRIPWKLEPGLPASTLAKPPNCSSYRNGSVPTGLPSSLRLRCSASFSVPMLIFAHW